ncbi:MAG: hypothetical protein J1G04_00755 [Clostridiales bacterium]|nr:hypothetical protein [Clostridiales bacterium]
MRNFAKKILATALAGCMAFSFVGCGNKKDGDGEKQYFNNEEDPLRLSTLEVDQVFNPFFSTSGTDSTVIGFTQLGMLGNDADGNPTYGDDEAVLVKDMSVVTEGDEPVGNAKDERITTYSFVLKNDVKFSNGSPVTIKDVLFNLYVYLDMAYTGSSTIYSTDIVGLKEYRTQESSEAEQDSFMKQYQIAAEARINALVSASNEIFDANPNKDFDIDSFEEELEKKQNGNNAAYKNLVKDYEKAIELFQEELETDYSNSLNSYEDTVFSDREGNTYEHLFTTDVEVFLYNEGYITWSRRDGELSSSITNNVSSLKNWTKNQAIAYIVEDMIPGEIEQVVQYWATSVSLFEFITNEELEADAATKVMKFPNISGIKFANGGAARGGADSVKVNGKDYATPTYASDGSVSTGNEVLTIQIHGVDPKAIWNFAFGVAPMYYYSDYSIYKDFDYVSNFGVRWSSQSFMQDIVNAPSKIGVPVGAGPYMASKDSGGTDNVTASDFYSNGVIYYERNPYYIKGPAKIKKLRLVVVSSTQMLNSLYTNSVDFAEPNAKPETVTEINGKKGYNSISIETAGYGYIGINAAKIPNINVRRAIMYSIDTSLCIDYYKSEATPIYRSMSTSSWAYPEGSTAYYPYIGDPVPANLDVVDPYYKNFVTGKGKKEGDKLTDSEQKEFIEKLMSDAGFSNASGTYRKGNHVCRYTFTIAGEVTDHPAWSALFNAGQRLNSYGFDITVKNDAQALKKLSSGALTVWGAAWGSTIDPDMYQVYHKDSTATSVLNWGYPQIIRNSGNQYDFEYGILNDLSKQIEYARETNNQKDRAAIYSRALDLVMQLAVELPTYQRNDLFAYNETRIDVNTFNDDLSSYKGLLSDIESVSLVTRSTQEQ